MTEWHSAEPAPEPQAGTARPAPRGRHAAARTSRRRRVPSPAGVTMPGRQGQVLVLAGVLLAAAVVLALVVLLGGSDGPAKGSPDAVTDAVASALHAGSASRLGALSCESGRGRVVQAAAAVLAAKPAARRQGTASVTGEVAVARVDVGSGRSATVGLSRVAGQWCVAAFAAAG